MNCSDLRLAGARVVLAFSMASWSVRNFFCANEWIAHPVIRNTKKSFFMTSNIRINRGTAATQSN
jgi:hypothetical protein